MMHTAWSRLEEVPYFFKVIRQIPGWDKKSSIFTQIGVSEL